MVLGLVFIFTVCLCSTVFLFILSKNKQEFGQIKGKMQHLVQENKILRQEKLENDRNLQEKVENLQNNLLGLEKDISLLDQEKDQLYRERKEWSKDKETILYKLSQELIEKNNQQQQAFSNQNQENIKKVTENLFKNFENVTAKVVSLNDDVKKSSDIINLTKQALLTPGAAGRTAEITLENILKNSGLKEKQDLNSVGDYVLQSHFVGDIENENRDGKRPDAVVFFPSDQIAVIDSKSSPHFLDLEEAKQAKNFEEEKLILNKIKDSFKRHVESLKKKDYAKSLVEELGTKDDVDYKVINIMFLQTEKMLEIIREVDRDFEQKAFDSGVIVATPIGLINFLSQARIVIDRVKQEKNVEKLKVEIKRLLDSVALIFKESKELGKTLNKAVNSHNKITKNLNRKVYSTIKNVIDLGVEGKKTQDIKVLDEYEDTDEDDTK